MTWAILASGQSLTQEQVDYVHAARLDGRLSGVVAVSNVGLDLAPWADALVSHDSSWWRHHPKAVELNMKKFCRMRVNGVETFIPSLHHGCNSGFMAMEVAWKIFVAKKLILLGFDMHGSHYFGPHPPALRNTSPDRFQVLISQFDKWEGPEVVNCTVGSALRRFPFARLHDMI